MGISAVLAVFGMALATTGVPGSKGHMLPCNDRLKPGLLTGAFAPPDRPIGVATAALGFTAAGLPPHPNAPLV